MPWYSLIACFICDLLYILRSCLVVSRREKLKSEENSVLEKLEVAESPGEKTPKSEENSVLEKLDIEEIRGCRISRWENPKSEDSVLEKLEVESPGENIPKSEENSGLEKQ